MWRWTRRILAGFVGLLVIAALAGALCQAWATARDLNADPPPGQLVDVGGHRLHIWCSGSGAPTVVWTPDWAARPSTGATSNRQPRHLRVSVLTIERGWAIANRVQHPGRVNTSSVISLHSSTQAGWLAG